jgi:hypothetical protein
LPELSRLIGKEVAQKAGDWLEYNKKSSEQDTDKDGPSLVDMLARMAGDGGGRETQANVLIGLAQSASLFHTPAQDTEAYADITINGHRETHRVRGRGFRQWLRHSNRQAAGATPRPCRWR